MTESPKRSYINTRQKREPEEQHKKQINNWGVNKRFKKKSRGLSKCLCLVIDTDRSNSRNALLNIGLPNSNIDTVDIETKKHLPTHHKERFKSHAENTYKKYDYVFADCISNGKNSIDQVKPLFKRGKLNDKCLIGVTFCPRNSRSSSNYFQSNMIRMATKCGYNLKPLKVPSKLRRGKSNNGKIKILKNWTDNIEFKRTGRTITAFFSATLIVL
jgi:hypothetical protein